MAEDILRRSAASAEPRRCQLDVVFCGFNPDNDADSA